MIWTWDGGSAWSLSGPLKRLVHSRIDLSLLQCHFSYQEKHGTLHNRPQIHLKRVSETKNHQKFSYWGTREPRDWAGRHFMRSECMVLVLNCVIHTSAAYLVLS